MTATRWPGAGMTSERARDRLLERLREEGIRSEVVLERIRTLPRHLFVDQALAHRAYDNTALPIGLGQTISQPWVVARMTELLVESGPLRCVLEVGTGSAYQTAILAPLCNRLYSVERIEALHLRAQTRLRELGFRRVRLFHRDGGEGLTAYGPYDAILATAAPREVPAGLLAQLEVGGRLVLPSGPDEGQRLLRITRGAQGYRTETFDAVSFVPLVAGLV